MTPARFDLLYVLRRLLLDETWEVEGTAWPKPKPTEGVMRQSSLWKSLGLHRSTVAKMVKRLLELNWIWKTKCEHDRRTWIIGLTEEGTRRAREAMRRVFRGKVVRKQYEHLFRPKNDERVLDVTLPRVSVVESAYMSPPPPPPPPSPPLRPDNPKDLHATLNDVYLTIRSIARYFGDESWVWYHLGGGHPKEGKPFWPRCSSRRLGRLLGLSVPTNG